MTSEEFKNHHWCADSIIKWKSMPKYGIGKPLKIDYIRNQILVQFETGNVVDLSCDVLEIVTIIQTNLK